MGICLLGIAANAKVQGANLYLRSGSSTCIYSGNSSQTLQSLSGTTQTAIAFSARTNTFSFYSALLTNSVYLAAGKKTGGTIGAQNNGSADFQFAAGAVLYDYDPATGIQTQIISITPSGYTTVGKNGNTSRVTLPQTRIGGSGYTIPAGHLLKSVITITVTANNSINGSLIYNASGGNGKSFIQLPQDNSVLWPFGSFDSTPNATITTPPSVQQNSTSNIASVLDAGFGATYVWSITNGTITAGQSTRQMTWSAGTSGTVGLGIVIVDGCYSASGSAVVSLNARTNQTITFSPISSQTYGNLPISLVASASSGLPVTFTIASGPATISGNVLTITGAGTVVVNANQSGNSNYNPAISQQTVLVNPMALTVSGITAYDKTYDGTTTATLNTNGALLVGVLVGDNVTLDLTFAAGYFTDANAGPGKTVQISGLDIDGTDAGNYTLTAPAATASISTAPLTITANDQAKICGQPNPALTASYSGFVGGDDTNALTAPAILSTPAIAGSAPGLYSITANGAAAENYTISYVNGTLTVVSAPQLNSTCSSVGGNNQFVMSWSTLSNQNYQVQYTASLNAPAWTPCGSPVTGTGNTVVVTNNMGAMPQCFFRLELLAPQ